MSRILYDFKSALDGKFTLAGNVVREVRWSRRHQENQPGLSTLGEPAK
jgi:hypothetical protein